MDDKEKNEQVDIQEATLFRQMPHILEILLTDRTTSTPKKVHNIIWANDNYAKYGPEAYKADKEIKPELITGETGVTIMPRALKERTIQQARTKNQAEVFTPTWVVKLQNDTIDKNYADDDLETYINRKWLEITCGEAPYMASRYEMATGVEIPLKERVGFVDRKLRRINQEVDDKAEWQRLAELAYKSSYGYEWSGDSLLLARENLLFTYRDFYADKWGSEPLVGLFEEVARIISYNVFQMDGLKNIIPGTEKRTRLLSQQLSFLDTDTEDSWEITPGKRVRIRNWTTDKMEYFDQGLN